MGMRMVVHFIVRMRFVIMAVRVACLMQMLRLRLLRVNRFSMWSLLKRCLVSASTALFGECIAFEDMNLGARDTAPIHFLDLQACPKAERRSCIVQHLRWHACVNQCSEKHVTGDAGKTIQISNAHKTLSWLVAELSSNQNHFAEVIAETDSISFIDPER